MVKSSQVSTEYLLITAFGFMVICVMSYALYSQFSSQTNQIEISKLQRFGSQLVEASNRISYMGDTSSITIEALMPAGVLNATVINNKTISFTFKLDERVSEVYVVSSVNVALDFSEYKPGIKKIWVQSKGRYNLICLKNNAWSCNNYCDASKRENASNAANDCCTSACNSCIADGRVNSCTNNSVRYANCYGHNGCHEIG